MFRTSHSIIAVAVLLVACERGPTAPVGATTPGVHSSAVILAAPGSVVSGSGTITFGSSIEHISVTTNGNSGRATFQDRAAGGNFNGQIAIDCVNIVGNTATLSGIITQSNNKDFEGQQAAFQIVDNGDGTDFASLINIYDPGTGPDCTSGEYDLSPVRGNFTIQQ